jgi:hypothetical protein
LTGFWESLGSASVPPAKTSEPEVSLQQSLGANDLISQQAIHALDLMPQGDISGNPLRQPAQIQMPTFQRRDYARLGHFRLLFCDEPR